MDIPVSFSGKEYMIMMVMMMMIAPIFYYALKMAQELFQILCHLVSVSLCFYKSSLNPHNTPTI